jgi:PAS domain S-box-containing protein
VSKRGWPLQADFAVIALLVLLVGAAAGALVYVRSTADAKQAAVTDATFAAKKAAAQIKLGFDTYESITGPAANSPSTAQVFAEPAGCGLGYAPVAGFDSGHVDIVRLDGSVVCSSLKTGYAKTYAGQDWLQATKPVIVAPVVDPTNGNQVAVYAYPIPGHGFLAWFVDLKPLGPKLASEYGSGAHQLEFLITTSDSSAVISRSLDSGKWTGAKLAGTPFASSTDVDGKPRWYAAANVDGAGWKVYVGADQAAALASVVGLQNGQLAITAAGVIAVLLAVFIVYRRVAKPIEQLSESVRSSRILDSPRPVPVGGPAQVADLAQDFNEMITSLQREWVERESAQQNYLRLFEGNPLPTMFVDQLTHRFLEVNDSAARAFGYSKGELVEMRSDDLLALTEEEAAALQAARATGATKSMVRFGPLTVRKKDGTALRALITSYEVNYGGRQAQVTMAEDVTSQERLERQLNQSQRLEGLGQLAGGVAHDFNNLLGVILNFAVFAKEKILAKEKAMALVAGAPDSDLQQAVKDMERVERAAESAARLTHQLLAFASRELIRPQSLNVNLVVADLEPLVGRTIGEHIDFITSPGQDLWPA